MNQQKENRWLGLVEHLRDQLGTSLRSLNGVVAPGLDEHYCFYSAAFINKTTHGYVLLRKSGMHTPSILLIRPILEAMFRLEAVRRIPALLTRVAFSEYLEERKMLKPLPEEQRSAALKLLSTNWEDFKKAYCKKYPERAFVATELNIYEAADKALMLPAYDTYYRLYCAHTHGALRATTGGLDNASPLDNRIVALSLMITIATGRDAAFVAVRTFNNRMDNEHQFVQSLFSAPHFQEAVAG